MNISQLLLDARLREREGHASQESGKLGTLRAGSTGMMDASGNVAGHCHRKSHLRSLGIELEQPSNDKLIMFELGIANEDVIVNQLRSILGSDYTILREEEIPIQWMTRNGTRVSGRPDIVICTGDSLGSMNPVLGLELKSVNSLWVARDVVFSGTPKTANLIQSAHYMWKLNIPYKLIYKNYGQLGQGMAGNEWIIKQFPRPGEPGSEFIEYSSKESKKTGQTVHTIKHIKQFEIVYDLQFDKHGRLQYKLEAADKWVNTVIVRDDIERYFEYVSGMGGENPDLGPRPLTINPQGEKLNWTDCSYCPLQKTCDQYESTGYENWLNQVKKLNANSAQVSPKNTDK